MKRILRLLIVILLLLTGCSSQQTPSVDSKDHLNMIKPPETIQSEEASEEETKAPITLFEQVTPLETEASREATEPSETLDVEHHRQDANTEPTEPQRSESPQESVPGVSEEATSSTEPVPTIPKEPEPSEPSVTEPVVIPTAPTDPPKEETQPTEPEPDPEPVFDIDYWIGYAKSYARSVGLNLDGTATDCWDNPITAGPHSTCLERDIQSRLNRYGKDEEITDVWIWAVPLGNGSYDLYIGYA